jgi:hypothetical protein
MEQLILGFDHGHVRVCVVKSVNRYILRRVVVVVLPTCSGSGRRQRLVMNAEPEADFQRLRLIDTT